MKTVEMWIDVPDTGSRGMVSNLGHLKVMGKRKRTIKRSYVAYVNEMRPLVCDFKTSRLGWWVFFDGERHFFAREDLMLLFPKEVQDVDRSRDEEAVEIRERNFRDLNAGKGGEE